MLGPLIYLEHSLTCNGTGCPRLLLYLPPPICLLSVLEIFSILALTIYLRDRVVDGDSSCSLVCSLNTCHGQGWDMVEARSWELCLLHGWQGYSC